MDKKLDKIIQLLEVVINNQNRILSGKKGSDLSKKQILSPKDVCKIVGVSRATLWRMEKRGDLPPKLQVSAGKVGWRKSDIENLLKKWSD